MPLETNMQARAISKAYRIGLNDGDNAAYWWLATADVGSHAGRQIMLERIVTRINADDPSLSEYLPQPDLSGEWADGYTPQALLMDCGGDEDSDGDLIPDLCDQYEQGFYEGVRSFFLGTWAKER